MSRLEDIVDQTTENPDYNMSLLLNTLTPSVIIPQLDQYYVFVYKAKTPRIQYDQNPFITCTGVYKWGFSGFNYHWKQPRRYSWNEVISNLYEVQEDEVQIVMNFPIAKFRTS